MDSIGLNFSSTGKRVAECRHYISQPELLYAHSIVFKLVTYLTPLFQLLLALGDAVLMYTLQ